MTRKTGYWLLAVLWTLIIITLLCLPGSRVPQQAGNFRFPPGTDMAVHVVLFSLLQILWVRSLQPAQPLQRSFSLRIGILIVAFGITMEFVQHFFVPNRSFEWEDIVADVAGVLAGHLYLVSLVKKR